MASQKKVSEIMSKQLCTLKSDATVFEASQKLKGNQIGCLAVYETNMQNVCGLLTGTQYSGALYSPLTNSFFLFFFLPPVQIETLLFVVWQRERIPKQPKFVILCPPTCNVSVKAKQLTKSHRRWPSSNVRHLICSFWSPLSDLNFSI